MDHQIEIAGADAAPAAPRLTLRLMLRDAVERLFDVERGWLRTARELTLGPGAMIRRYVDGHRKVYTNPFAYLVVGSAVSIIVQKTVGFQERMVSTARASTTESPLQMEFVNRFTELVFQNGLYLTFGMLVPMALLARLFFRKSGYNLAECFVFALYSGGHLALLGVFLVPLYMLLPPSTWMQGAVGLAVAIIYSVYAARGFFSGNLVTVAFKICLAYIVAYFLFLIVMMVCVAVYVIVVMLPTSSGVDWDLVTATEYEAIPVIEKLLDEGADIDMTLKRTALHAAAELGNLEIVELLIRRGADLDLKDIHGRVPMFVAAVNHHPEVATRLAEAGTDPSVLTTDGSTLLMAAVRIENVELARWALDHGVDVNAARPKKNHATALMMAAGSGNADMVELLLSRGADPRATNHEGETALELAKGKEVRELLRESADRAPPGPSPTQS
jgi:ankyrin repeat protein